MSAFNNNNNRLSTLSSISAATRTAAAHNQSAQVSTQTLLNALHTSFLNSGPAALESSTSLAVNTWMTVQTPGPDGIIGGTVDSELAHRVWEHARRRAEDGSVVLGSLHHSSPSTISAFAAALPLDIPTSFFTALDVIRAFTHCVTPFNPSLPRYSSLAAKFTLNTEGSLLGSSLALSTSGLDTQNGLMSIPYESGFRAFDVFYYLNVSSASKAEREVLNLKPSSSYTLLKRSGTFMPPTYLPTADDAAAAEDFRQNLRALGIKGSALQNLIAALCGILKLGDSLDYLADQDTIYRVCEDAAALLDMDPMLLRVKLTQDDRKVFIAGLYEAVVDWVIRRSNEAMRAELKAARAMTSSNPSRAESPLPDEFNEDTVAINLINIPDPDLGRAIALRTVFDDTQGINLEMKEDGVPIIPAGASVVNEMRSAVTANGPELGDLDSAAGRERDIDHDRRQGVMENVAQHADADSFVKELLHPAMGKGVVLGTADAGGRFDLSNTLSASRTWFQLNIHPTDDTPATLATSTNHWSAAAVSSQLRSWRLPEWANRRNKVQDLTADFDFDEFVERYAALGCGPGKDGIETWLLERGWTNGEVVIGESRIWLRESAWWEAECQRDELPIGSMGPTPMDMPFQQGYFPSSQTHLIPPQAMSVSGGRTRSITPTNRNIIQGDYGLGSKGDQYKGQITYDGHMDAELADGKVIENYTVGTGRRVWVFFVWMFTFWIPSPLLRYVGRMKRPDVRLAWREKVFLCMIILFINGVVVFYIIFFGKILCPNIDKAWNTQQVSYHQGDNDFYVSHRGKVYDISKWWKTPHSDISSAITDKDSMGPFAGLNVDAYINPPLVLACPHLVDNDRLTLIANNTPVYPNAYHISGPMQTAQQSKLSNPDWYSDNFLPTMKKFYKGDLVWDTKTVKDQGQAGYNMWVIIDNNVYDLTDYFYSRNDVGKGDPRYQFMPSWFEDLVTGNSGFDVTNSFQAQSNVTSRKAVMQCLDSYFYTGRTDFRKSARCQVNNYLLLAFTIILCTVIGVKFLSALQLGSKRRPAQQDKFVICQVPAYTEGEDQLRKGLDSLTALAYDNKRKLICVICDGVIVGAGNDRPTPKIVLDILGVDPKTDPPALPFKSVGQGSEQLNYGKVYSGLYEYEGNVVPYLVVVKVGKESEQNKPKPGNRGKRDSQIMLMSFLNRVHHRSPMSPLELEMFHQINNVIGVDPELYEYVLMVDADTMVVEDSLNRLVSACANDAKIAGICGETSLQNEERSWWTMIQVYEYFISHHLAKAFESLFGSVTCLPGCFCMYRLRTADRGRPLIISDKVIQDYSDGNVDTLHKKNLFSLGEDRYLTTLMMKHFPNMSYKFVPSALAHTAAPDQWSVLLSQRRRWINSTIHNLAELIFLKDMCGFCFFSMRFVVFIDLTGTIILPATCAYLGYLIYRVATHSGQFPLISIIMLAAVYGLQAIIFIIKRQWQHVGWMIIYIIAFPIYSFVLPVYSFWKQDDFSWGSTRLILEEKGQRKVVAVDNERFDPRSVPLMRWDDYAAENSLPGGRDVSEKMDYQVYEDPIMDTRSVISSIKMGSQLGGTSYPMMPINTMSQNPRASMYSLGARSSPNLVPMHGRNMSLGGISNPGGVIPRPGSQVYLGMPNSTENLNSGVINRSSPNLPAMRSSVMLHSRPGSQLNLMDNRSSMVNLNAGPVNFMDGPKNGPSDNDVVMAVRDCLSEVDIERVTKKHVIALAELKLQCQLQGDRKAFLSATIDRELEAME